MKHERKKGLISVLALLLAAMTVFCLVACSGTAVEGKGLEPKGDVSAYGGADGYFSEISGEYEVYASDCAPEGKIGIGDEPDAPDVQARAGLLTAAEWKDLDHWDFWTDLVNKNDWYALMESWGLWTNRRIAVHVGDEDASAYNVPVVLSGSKGVVYRAVTDRAGNAYLFYTDKDDTYSVTVGTGNAAQTIVWAGEDTLNVTAPCGKDKVSLDLLFMVDTTGSMGDELKFLQAELADVIRAVRETLQISVRVSVNFYRDTEDEYLVRSFPFTADLEEVQGQLSAQYSDGGGDYPEAVHTALDDAVNLHDWDENSVKLVFFVADAPAHAEASVKASMKDSLSVAAAKGIRIIPVASSGVDTSCEELFRSFAILTGGTYVFLTNDSGIGGDHLEATVGEHEVEKLNELMIRVIGDYYQGK